MERGNIETSGDRAGREARSTFAAEQRRHAVQLSGAVPDAAVLRDKATLLRTPRQQKFRCWTRPGPRRNAGPGPRRIRVASCALDTEARRGTRPRDRPRPDTDAPSPEKSDEDA